MKKFIGTGVALVTPFDKEKNIDFDALKRLVRFNIDNNIDYLVINGTTGESSTILLEEKKEIIKIVSNENKKQLPLVLGVGGNSTKQVVDDLQNIDLSEIDAILSVAPYYTKPTQEGFYQHYKQVSLVSTKPVILYNVPGRTSKNIEPSTILRLSKDFKNIIGVKEAGNNQQQYYMLLKNRPKDFLIISGDDDLALGVVLAGGDGVISVIGQAFPNEFSKMINLGLEGKNNQAYKLYYKLMDIILMIFEENNPSGVKALLNKLEICKNELRLPLVKVSEKLQNKISNFVDNF